MKRCDIGGALALSDRLDAIDAQIEKLTNAQECIELQAVWLYSHRNGGELARTDVSREEALGMMNSLRQSLVVQLRQMGVSDAE